MRIGMNDVRDVLRFIRWNLRAPGVAYPKPGKYSVPHKLLHHVITVIVLTALVTGLLMMVKIDTPFWERDPYWLMQDTWGLIYVLHDLAALCLISLILIHIYFAFRPEKLFYTRSMIKGWITDAEYQDNHDQERWTTNE